MLNNTSQEMMFVIPVGCVVFCSTSTLGPSDDGPPLVEPHRTWRSPDIPPKIRSSNWRWPWQWPSRQSPWPIWPVLPVSWLTSYGFIHPKKEDFKFIWHSCKDQGLWGSPKNLSFVPTFSESMQRVLTDAPKSCCSGARRLQLKNLSIYSKCK